MGDLTKEDAECHPEVFIYMATLAHQDLKAGERRIHYFKVTKVYGVVRVGIGSSDGSSVRIDEVESTSHLTWLFRVDMYPMAEKAA